MFLWWVSWFLESDRGKGGWEVRVDTSRETEPLQSCTSSESSILGIPEIMVKAILSLQTVVV